MATRTATRLEVHAHSYVRGPLATAGYRTDGKWHGTSFEHAHADGDVGHEHPDTGPACYTLDRDEWYAATGLRGGGRKAYRTRPTGVQLALVRRTAEQRRFRVVFSDRGLTAEHVRAGVTELDLVRARRDFAAAAAGALEPVPDDGGPGGGGATVARMVLGHDLTPVYAYEDLRGEATS